MRKTGKMLCALLALAMAAGWLALGMPIACAQTFSQMKESIPESVAFIIDGETVEVPVILPDVETLPIGYTCPLDMDEAKMKEIFGDAVEQAGDDRLNLRVVHSSPRGGTLYLESGIAPQVEIAPERAGEKFLEIIEKSGLPLEYRVEKILACAGWYETREVEVSLIGKEKEVEYTKQYDLYPSFTRDVPDFSRPVEGKEGGTYRAIMVQLAGGVPIQIVASPGGGSGFFGPYISMDMWSENDYSFSFVYTRQPCGTGAEPELAPFESIVKAVQARIDEGWLRAVDSLELCYGETFRLVNGKKVPYRESNENNPFGVLVPAWKVNGYDRIHLAQRVSNAYEDPTPFERYSQIPPKGFHITYDATTGELWNRKGWEDR